MVDDSQLELLGQQRPATITVETQDELARGCQDRHHALVKCYEASNLKPKQVYGPLEIDQTTFSRILSGAAHPDPNLYFRWMHACGNLIPFRYDAFKLEHAITPWRSGVEAELEQTKQELEDERRVNRRLVSMLRNAP